MKIELSKEEAVLIVSTLYTSAQYTKVFNPEEAARMLDLSERIMFEEDKDGEVSERS